LNIPFPPYEIFLSLLPGKPFRSFKSIQAGDLFPAKKDRPARVGQMILIPSAALQSKITYHSTLAWRRESMMLTEKNLSGIDFKN
jgi:hypothetical protein